ncbi:hypothetical protein, partial [Roseovarius sp.]|uniref:hypothetical protein n=1 Tax=Roseovarius sp. TaxID=1486281 RepID=UPI003A972E6A
MRLQHNSPDPPNQEGDSFAALRQDSPEAAVRNGLKGRNPNRSFAAGVFDVSVADKTVFFNTSINDRFCGSTLHDALQC